MCLEGQELCGGVCTDIKTSNSDCGACGQVCAGGTSCEAGKCKCPGSLAECNGACVDTQISSQHCGDCLQACPPGKQCVSGKCE